MHPSLNEKVHAVLEGKQVKTATFIWMQGESDLNNTAYDRYLTELLNQLAEDIEFKGINFVIGRISDAGLDNPNRLEGRKTPAGYRPCTPKRSLAAHGSTPTT